MSTVFSRGVAASMRQCSLIMSSFSPTTTQTLKQILLYTVYGCHSSLPLPCYLNKRCGVSCKQTKIHCVYPSGLTNMSEWRWTHRSLVRQYNVLLSPLKLLLLLLQHYYTPGFASWVYNCDIIAENKWNMLSVNILPHTFINISSLCWQKTLLYDYSKMFFVL